MIIELAENSHFFLNSGYLWLADDLLKHSKSTIKNPKSEITQTWHAPCLITYDPMGSVLSKGFARGRR